jgi:tRNA (cmo5U34)-methyltransferase
MTKFTFATSKEGFDNHIEKSVRGYTNLWNDVLSISKYFVEDHTNVVDVGCSTGKLLKAMMEQNKQHIPNANYIGVEIEEDFFTNYEQDEKNYQNLKYVKGDIRKFNFNNCSLVTSIFTLQFMPPKDRTNIISKIYDGLNHGGAFVFSEKTFSCDPQIQDMMTFMFYDYKRQFFTEKEILDKEVQLRHMMKPNTKTEIFDMCHKAGFTTHVFWQNFNFVGIVALKK